MAGDYAAGIRPGAFLEFDYDLNRKEGAYIAAVRAAWSGAGKKRLAAAYGVALRGR